jgi:hypothetical protein
MEMILEVFVKSKPKSRSKFGQEKNKSMKKKLKKN